ncbi:MAG TPA: hypothetical protein VMI72_09085, partial [Roseiarcus sp.]|nr:hypothetical protein [Roseiarcus sp.]
RSSTTVSVRLIRVFRREMGWPDNARRGATTLREPSRPFFALGLVESSGADARNLRDSGL